MNQIVTNRNTLPELTIVTKNDEVYDQIVNDKEFYQQMQQRNEQANQMMNLTEAGNNAGQNAEVLVKNTNEDWINKKWRPAMGWMYMSVCICDFIIFPVLWSLLQALTKGQVTAQYQPATLMGAGLFHMAMGAVLGIAVYGRTKEKLADLPIQNTNTKL
jgi:hypothetical protein